jgi:hypothetical protein
VAAGFWHIVNTQVKKGGGSLVHCEQLQPASKDGSILLIGKAFQTYVDEGMRIRYPPDNLGNL